jgi:hypothetical protein
LNTFPNRGRKGRVACTRELPFPPLPFIIVYRIRPGEAQNSTEAHERVRIHECHRLRQGIKTNEINADCVAPLRGQL